MNNLINEKLVNLNLVSQTKEDVIRELAQMLQGANRVSDLEGFIKDVFTREAEMTTGLGEGFGLPHAQSEFVTEPTIVFGRTSTPIDYSAIDGKPVDCFFMIAVPKSTAGEHLKILQNLARNLIKEDFISVLRNSQENKEVVELILDTTKPEEEAPKAATIKKDMKIVAISNCPAGIAHTYMVAEKLETICKDNGIGIKVETQGASGVENKLSAQEIKDADYVILALGRGITDADKKRFAGKKVVYSPINEVLKNINDILDNLEAKSTVFAAGDTTEEAEEEKGGIYEHLMSGVSFMIPYVVVGGLLLSLSTLILNFATEGTMAHELGVMFETVGVYGFIFMVPILGAYIAYSIGDKPALAPAFMLSYMANDKALLGTEAGAGFIGSIIVGLAIGYFVKWLRGIKVNKSIQPLMGFLVIPFVATAVGALGVYLIVGPVIGGLMAAMTQLLANSAGASAMFTAMLIGMMVCFDAGGPINKTAYLFALGLVAEGIFSFFGVVAVAVIVPTLAAGVASRIRPNLFSDFEVENGISAIISSMFGISEPGIPYIVNDPKALVPANLITGAYIGFSCMLLGVERMSPGPGMFEPLLGITTPALAFYFCVISAAALNVVLIITFKSLRQKKAAKA